MPPKKTSILPEKFDHVMIDFETLHTLAHAAILSIGAVKFNEQNIADDAFYRIITIDSNLAEGRGVSESTLGWWLKQDEKAKAIFDAPNKVTLDLALAEFRAWFGTSHEADHVKVWSNGASFDIPMMAHAYGNQGTPWKFYNERCFRTIKNMQAAKNVPAPVNQGAHNALYDAIAQAQHLQAIWKAGIGK